MKSCWVIISVFFVILASWIAWLKNQARSNALVQNFQSLAERTDFEYKHGLVVGECKYPYVWRNAMKYNEYENCKSESTNYCGNMIKQRMIKFWGNRDVESFPDSMIVTHQDYSDYITDTTSLSEYFTNNKYKNNLILALAQLGTENEYKEFLMFNNKSTDLYSTLTNTYDWQTAGSHFFITNHKKTGTRLHFAFGLNFFLMLAGRKRWILIHPAYLKDSQCYTGMTGILGNCVPNNYLPPHSNVSVSEYKRILLDELNVPSDAIIDITLNPGDILVNCPLWAHTVENLDDITIGFATRAGLKKMYKNFKDIIFIENFINAVYMSLKTKLWDNDWNKFTILDALANGGAKPDALDKDDRLDRSKSNNFINSKTNKN